MLYCGLLIFILFLLSPDVSGKSRFVPSGYNTIQKAIDASSVNDTVIIEPGIYYENLVLTKNIILASRFIQDGNPDHIQKTIIDGSRGVDPKRASTIYISGECDSGCIITGLTIRGGMGSILYDPEDILFPYWNIGGGICLINAGATIEKNIITANFIKPNKYTEFTAGGAIGSCSPPTQQLAEIKLIIRDNIITGNESTGKWSEGGGIAVGQTSEISRNIITKNRTFSVTRSAGGGVALYLQKKITIRVFGNYISQNSAGIGAGLLAGGGKKRTGELLAYNNIISDNNAIEVGGGVHIARNAMAVLYHNTITGNKTKAPGGGINLADGAYTVLNNNILWKNIPDQIYEWGRIQVNYNLIEGGYHGVGNIDADPGFISDDTLFRISANSPCIAAGLKRFTLAGRKIELPEYDYSGKKRIQPISNNPDLGAHESEANIPAHEQSMYTEENYIKLLFNIKQSGVQRTDPATGEIIEAGKMLYTMEVNDNGAPLAEPDEEQRIFTLPAGENTIDIEIIARGRDSMKNLLAYIMLEGVDQRAIQHTSQHDIFFNRWSNLKPGTYYLSILPQDDNNIIGGVNLIKCKIIVLPFWYQTWWAFLLYTLAVFFAAFVYMRIRISSIKSKNELNIKQNELGKLSELDKLKSRFLANVAHELRTPLTLILGPAETLTKMKLKKEAGEHIQLIRRSAHRLLRQVDTLLQFSRVESGSARLKVFNHNIVPHIARVVSYFASPAARKNLTISFNAVTKEIHGQFDHEIIEEIVQNLMSNAVKFTQSGGSVQAEVKEESGFLNIRIADTGMGISDQDKPHIFERFFRADTTHKTEGTGIGLSLTKELTELHHGRISIESYYGEGTTVTVSIPLSGYLPHETGEPLTEVTEEYPDDSVLTPSENDTEAADAGEKQIILLAEDNADTRIYLRSILQKFYTVIESEDGARALEKTRITIPDLIITDIMMPDMDGIELCHAIKNDERTSHIPVIILSALAEKKDKLNGLHEGADDYLLKPFDAEELLSRVENLLESRRKLRESFSRKVMLQPGEVSFVSLDEKFMRRAIEVAEKHLSDEKFGVDQLAHEMFLSYAQFYRKIKALTNLSPVDFIRILRLERAKKLLETNWGSIADVADEVGFINHSYFAKCFHDRFGIHPHDVPVKKGNSSEKIKE